MSLLSKAVRVVEIASNHLKNALAEPKVRSLLDSRTPAAAGAQCVVYFAEEPLNAYQVRQWYEPLRRLSIEHPVTVLVRKPLTAGDLAADSPVAVQLAKNMPDLETFITEHPVKVVFYVNNNKENFLMLRFPGPAHVHLSHGESDKTSMTSNQLKAYDKVFIAGEASRERILRELNHFDAEHLVEIGRPQLDAPREQRTLPDDGRTVVLYAPTWEGDRPAMAYGSIVSHGEMMVARLLADPSIRLIYRPHPRVGVHDKRQAAASASIKAAIDAANRNDRSAGHIVDDARDFGWPLDAADVCICDISAVAADWLATRKPLLVTQPADPAAKVDPDGLAGALDLLPASEASTVNDVIAHRRREGTPQHQLSLVEHHFGDTSPDASTRRFIAAVQSMISTGH